MAYLLIVDDDPDFASSVATVCQADGHEVLSVHTPADALASVAQRGPDDLLLESSGSKDLCPSGSRNGRRGVSLRQSPFKRRTPKWPD